MMAIKRVGWIAVAAAMAWSQSGCSFMFTKGPPANHAKVASVECTDSKVWPAIDLLWAGLNGVGAVSAALDNSGSDQDMIMAVGLNSFVLAGISGIAGLVNVRNCKDARRHQDEQRALARHVAPAPPAQPAAPVQPAPPAIE